MANLKKLARGQECQVRIPGICNFNSETTVLAHIRMPGITGVGMKAPDLLGAWCCSSCHDVLDRRVEAHLSPDDLFNYHAEGVFRTQNELVKIGAVKC